MISSIALSRVQHNMHSIAGKVALLTGGSSGIGAVIAKEFLQEGLKGIAILDVNVHVGLQVVKELNDEFGNGKAVFIKTDVSDREQFENAFKKTVEVFNQLDIVVNNAAAKGELNWERNLAINLTGIVNGTILAHEHYLQKYRSTDEAVIINIGSLAGLYRFPSTPIYSAAKAGVIGLTRSLGSKIHYNRTKIKVICICPGYTKTSVTDIKKEDLLGSSYFEIQESFIKHSPDPQPASAVYRALVEVIKKGSSGSVWVAENNEPAYELQFIYNRKSSL